MNIEIAVIAALLLASVVGMVAQRLRLPYTVSLVFVGIACAIVRDRLFAGFDPGLHLTPQLLFTVLLPALVYEAAFHLELRHFVDTWRAVLMLAVPGVVVGTGLTFVLSWGVLSAFGIAVPWQVLLLAATILAATDPVGVLALLREVNAPRRLAMIMEGESLLNDGIAIVAFGVVLTALGIGPHQGGITLGWVAGFLTWEILGAVLIGGGLGLGLSWLTSTIDDHLIEITLTTISAFGSFVLAEQVHASGIIACLVAGVLSGNVGATYGMSASTRVAVTSFWEYAAFVANSIVFLLVGLETSPGRLLRIAVPVVTIWLAMLVARALFIAGALPTMGPHGISSKKGLVAVLSWGGLRGGVAMVLALSVPRTYAFRQSLIDLVFGAVLLSILAQAPTMPLLLRLLGIGRDRHVAQSAAILRTRLRALSQAEHYLERQREVGAVLPEVYQELRDELTRRRQDVEVEAEALRIDAGDVLREEQSELRRQLAIVEKETVRQAFAQGAIDEQLMRRLVREIDNRILALKATAEQI
jgi:Na+:H+ antiporter